ncbi:CBL-interacting serine/threonine-protein kinase 14-like [Gastrolobium bilobum]|uniref:CBL-interacting serine/threonine-protein kinase 14-like n=1 Tax=Gastrolobium bilobum TaxID=150636 RepID=UPI002AAF71C2|nr:CBL-interacting serine/threonine-protein kinase 14-like [Gastrolobium bilobum]
MSETQNDTVTETETETALSTTKDEVAPVVVLFGKYELRRLLGVGASGKVYHATNLDTGQSVAVKVVSKHKVLNGGFAANVEREISIMRRLNHPNIVNLFEVLATKTKIYFVMEFASGGELFSEVADKGRLTEDLGRRYFQQLISAVKHCHSQSIFHRDLKLDNLLIDENGNLKVSDFGLSAVEDQIRPDGLLHTVCGTPTYVAPEILAKRGYDGEKVDVWSCGVVLYALTAGYLPFNDYNITILYRKIYRGQFRCPKWTSNDLRNLLSRLLDPNPQTRITVDEILQDTWFKTGGYRPDRVLLKQPEWEEARTGFKSLNAFDLISFSSGLDMSGLFSDPSVLDTVERVVSGEEPERIMEKVEEVANGARFTVTRKGNGGGAKLEGQDGNLIALVVVYRLTDELAVVEVKSNECGAQFCKDKLCPQLLELAHKQIAPVFR